jgi:hypothetical protein
MSFFGTIRYQAKLLMSLVYGYDVKSYSDRLLVVARKMAELGSAVLPGTVLVNEIPLCELFHPRASRTIDFDPLQ